MSDKPASKHHGLPFPPTALAAALVLQRVTSPKPEELSRTRRVVGNVLTGLAFSLFGTTVGAYRHEQTTVDPTAPETASTLIVSGTNKISRNPMYVSMVGLLAGQAVLRGSWRAWLPVAAFAVAVDQLQIRTEERALHARFGNEYNHYCSDVPRWLGTRSLGVLK